MIHGAAIILIWLSCGLIGLLFINAIVLFSERYWYRGMARSDLIYILLGPFILAVLTIMFSSVVIYYAFISAKDIIRAIVKGD